MSTFKKAVFVVAVNLAGCASCPPTIADTALDAVLVENLPENVGSIAFDLQREPKDKETGGSVLGECVLFPNGTRGILLYMKPIRKLYPGAMTYPALLAVLKHEVNHAVRGGCTDADHSELM